MDPRDDRARGRGRRGSQRARLCRRRVGDRCGLALVLRPACEAHAVGLVARRQGGRSATRRRRLHRRQPRRQPARDRVDDRQPELRHRMWTLGLEAGSALDDRPRHPPGDRGPRCALAPGTAPRPALARLRGPVRGAILTFGLYTAVKAAFLSTVFATRVEERNLIYLGPLILSQRPSTSRLAAPPPSRSWPHRSSSAGSCSATATSSTSPTSRRPATGS